MGRFFMYSAIAGLALFVVSSYAFINHGGGAISAVQEVSIQQLTLYHQQYEGQPVIVRGELQYSDEHEAYQVVEANPGVTVLVHGFGNAALLESLLGEEVRVNGTFGFNDDEGAFIQAQVVQRASDSSQ